MEILSLIIGFMSKMWQVADCGLKLYCDVAAKEANSDWGEHCKAVYPTPFPGGSPGRYNVWEYQKPLRYHSVVGGTHSVTHQRSNRGPISKILLPYLCNKYLSGAMHLQIRYKPKLVQRIFSTLSFPCRWPMVPSITHHCCTYQTMQKTLVVDGLFLWMKVQIGP